MSQLIPSTKYLDETHVHDMHPDGGAPRALTLAATPLPGDLAAPAHDEHGAAARLARLDKAHVRVEAARVVVLVHVELDCLHRPRARPRARALDELEQRVRVAVAAVGVGDVELVEEDLRARAAPLGAGDREGDDLAALARGVP